jgi:hypothetical protein
MADDGKRGHDLGARSETILYLLACGLAGAVAAVLWLRFGG